MPPKTVLLTGASRGIGLAAVQIFAAAGYNVAAVARHIEPQTALAETLPDGKILPIQADLSTPDAAATIVERTRQQFQGIDILINNAGIGITGAAHRASIDDIEMVMAVNYLAPVQLMQAVIPVMQANGGGLIINVSSIIGKRATPFSGGYCASKAALEHMVESMRMELAADNVRFSTLYPGVTRTTFTQHTLGEPRARKGRVQGVSAERAAQTLLRMAKKEPRDAYVTLFDRIFVVSSHLFPKLFDVLLSRYMR